MYSALGLPPSAAARPAGSDPFAPGLRWTRAAEPTQPWIPKSIAFGADDNLVWIAAGAAHPHLELCSSHLDGTVQPWFRDDSVAAAVGVLAVAAGSATGSFFSIAQYPQPDALHRRTEVARYSPQAAALGGTFAPVWNHDLGFTTNGAARIACSASGARVASAVWNDQLAAVDLRWFDGETGATTAQASVAAPTLNEIAVSADGARLALAAGLALRVFDADAALVHAETLASATPAIALSGDGRALAVGGIGKLRLLAKGASGYANDFDVLAPANEIAARTALSADGRTLAVGWWNAASGTSLRFEVWDVPSQARVFASAQDGVAGGLQNLPAAVAVTGDGSRIAFGCWGDGTSNPEIILVDRASASIALAADLPGSVQALALDASGTRLAVALKHAHANVFATSGEVRLYDTGERDLAVLGQPQAGGVLSVAARHAGASHCLFLVGRRMPAPTQVPGTTGELWLERASLEIFARRADASGRADLALPIASDPALIGTELHMQAAFRAGGGLHFGTTVVDPLIL